MNLTEQHVRSLNRNRHRGLDNWKIEGDRVTAHDSEINHIYKVNLVDAARIAEQYDNPDVLDRAIKP
jgi:hypothetical protein